MKPFSHIDDLGAVSILGFPLIIMGHYMLKIRRPVGRLNFNMELPIPVGRNPDIDTTPWCTSIVNGQEIQHYSILYNPKA